MSSTSSSVPGREATDVPDQSRRRSPRSGRHPGVPGYKSPEKSLDYFRELEHQRIREQEDTISWLNDIFSIR